MHRPQIFWVVFTAATLILAGGLSAEIQLQYRGGPVLDELTIHPLFYGIWSEADIVARRNYLVRLADYVSGDNAPQGQRPVLWQYGVHGATLSMDIRVHPDMQPVALHAASVPHILLENRGNGNLPPGNALVVVFLAKGFSLPFLGKGCSYHSNAGVLSPFAAVTYDCAPDFLAIAREVFGASVNPEGNGWDEPADNCLAPVRLSFEGISIPGLADNTQGGTCSSTGHISAAKDGTGAISIHSTH